MNFSNKISKIYIFLLSAIAITIPMPMLANNISIILLFVFWLFLMFKQQLIIPSFKHLIILSIPFIILLIGIINTTNYRQLTLEITKNLPFLMLPIIVFSCPVKLLGINIQYIFKFFITGNLIICTYLLGIIIKTIFDHGFSIESQWGLTHQSLSVFVGLNAIYLSLFIAISLLYIAYTFINDLKTFGIKSKLIFSITFVVLLIVLIFLSSRTVIFSCFLLMSIMLFQHYLKKDNFFKVLLIFFIVGSILVPIVFIINPVLKWRVESVLLSDDFENDDNKEEGVLMRENLWKSGFEVFRNNYLFGVGTGDFKDELNKTYRKNKHRVQYRFEMNSHNQYLSLMVSNGLIGLSLFLFYIFYPLTCFFRYKNTLLYSIVLLFAICFITESYLYTNKGVVVVAFIFTILYKNHLDIQNDINYEKE